MALLLCHSPKGGTGTTFLSAQLALALSQQGREVTVLTTCEHDTLPLHFGVMRPDPLPSFGAGTDEAVVVRGIDLRRYAKAATDPYFIPRLQEYGHLDGGSDRLLIVDVPSAERRLLKLLMPMADLRVCALAATPDSMALLPELYEQNAYDETGRMRFVLNKVDETRRLSRHIAAFARELCGDRLLGRVHFDEAVPEAMASLQTVMRYSPGSAVLADIRGIAEKIAPWLGSGGQQSAVQSSQASHAA